MVEGLWHRSQVRPIRHRRLAAVIVPVCQRDHPGWTSATEIQEGVLVAAGYDQLAEAEVPALLTAIAPPHVTPCRRLAIWHGKHADRSQSGKLGPVSTAAGLALSRPVRPTQRPEPM